VVGFGSCVAGFFVSHFYTKICGKCNLKCKESGGRDQEQELGGQDLKDDGEQWGMVLLAEMKGEVQQDQQIQGLGNQDRVQATFFVKFGAQAVEYKMEDRKCQSEITWGCGECRILHDACDNTDQQSRRVREAEPCKEDEAGRDQNLYGNGREVMIDLKEEHPEEGIGNQCNQCGYVTPWVHEINGSCST